MPSLKSKVSKIFRKDADDQVTPDLGPESKSLRPCETISITDMSERTRPPRAAAKTDAPEKDVD